MNEKGRYRKCKLYANTTNKYNSLDRNVRCYLLDLRYVTCTWEILKFGMPSDFVRTKDFRGDRKTAGNYMCVLFRASAEYYYSEKVIYMKRVK